ncbi:hypothetical protein E2C01_016132 [Portunus trituberculatus]|uniref:Uncharacterized protein n=1 Tax=Portunus trituberculatus TaxID=210409 RepID=A0A5B7DPG3_PORTR|nr:hypothetical protein [Portunus trituberculatus]
MKRNTTDLSSWPVRADPTGGGAGENVPQKLSPKKMNTQKAKSTCILIPTQHITSHCTTAHHNTIQHNTVTVPKAHIHTYIVLTFDNECADIPPTLSGFPPTPASPKQTYLACAPSHQAGGTLPNLPEAPAKIHVEHYTLSSWHQ